MNICSGGFILHRNVLGTGGGGGGGGGGLKMIETEKVFGILKSFLIKTFFFTIKKYFVIFRMPE